ncbi:FAD-dependent oxidoreductase [Pseudonocardia zijingensis]|uniref:FAD-dependent oxidoreductase n=1 Tax=Pseudonocardia zijingensis TaxID=153376 RepID=A0ABN1NBY7_9PSEU
MRVVVIGSGIAGASCAYHLARRGVSVVVVDDARPGVATDAGAGIVSSWASADEAVFALAAPASAYYPELVAALAEDTAEPTSYSVVGFLVTDPDPAALGEVQRRAAARAAQHPAAGTVSLLDPPQAGELFPPLDPGLAAVHVSGGARVDGRQLRAAQIDAARRRGAELRTGTAVPSAEGVRVDGEPLGADAVVVAAGAWSGELAAALGAQLPVAPQRGQITHLGLGDDHDTASWPTVSPHGTGHYLLAFPGGRVVVGATRETGSGFDHRVTAAGQLEVLDHALTVAPGLCDATFLETRVGFRPATPDGLPVLGPLPDHPRVVLATGFGHLGLTLAPLAGALVAATVLGETPLVDVRPYGPERFATAG